MVRFLNGVALIFVIKPYLRLLNADNQWYKFIIKKAKSLITMEPVCLDHFNLTK